MSERKNEIINELNESAAETLDYYASLTPEQLAVQVYTDGAQWSARQVLAHLITIEKSMQRLFDNILAGGPGSPEGFDVERFNRSQPKKLEGWSMEALLARYKTVRRTTIEMVESMNDADLDRQGRHAFHGPGKLERFVRWAYEHNRMHIEDVRRVL